MKKSIIALILVFSFFILGCTSSPEELAMEYPESKDFLEKYPDAEMSISTYSEELLREELSIWDEKCSETVPVQDYYLAELNDPESGQTLVMLLEKGQLEVVCSFEQKREPTVTDEYSENENNTNNQDNASESNEPNDSDSEEIDTSMKVEPLSNDSEAESEEDEIRDTAEECNESWECTEWGECIEGYQHRQCTGQTICDEFYNIPDVNKTCEVQEEECIPMWGCTEWGECLTGEQTRTCFDLVECDNEENKPEESRECEIIQPQNCNAINAEECLYNEYCDGELSLINVGEDPISCCQGDCVLMTCNQQQGYICGAEDTCTGSYISASDSESCCSEQCTNPCENVSCLSYYEKCVDGSCVKKSCSEINGEICSSGTVCDSWDTQTTSDGECCMGSCKQPTNVTIELVPGYGTTTEALEYFVGEQVTISSSLVDIEETGIINEEYKAQLGGIITGENYFIDSVTVYDDANVPFSMDWDYIEISNSNNLISRNVVKGSLYKLTIVDLNNDSIPADQLIVKNFCEYCDSSNYCYEPTETTTWNDMPGDPFYIQTPALNEGYLMSRIEGKCYSSFDLQYNDLNATLEIPTVQGTIDISLKFE